MNRRHVVRSGLSLAVFIVATLRAIAGYSQDGVIDPNSAGTLYAIIGGVVQKSTDRGMSWREVLRTGGEGCIDWFPCAAVRVLAIDPRTNPSTLYAGTDAFTYYDEQLWHVSGDVFKSTDGGASWARLGLASQTRWIDRWVDGHSVSALAVDPRTAGTTLYAGTDGGPNAAFSYDVFKSTDGGVSWEGTGLRRVVTFLAIDPVTPTTLYAGTPSGIYKSTDGAVTWHSTPLATRPSLLLRRRADFNRDARSDVLWRNSSTGENYLYPMSGNTILWPEDYLRTVSDLDWRIAGVGDFDGDARADILWRNGVTGENYVYFMNGTSIVGEGYLRTVSDLDWRVAGVGDFDGDGRDDILWRNAATGENYIFLMNALSVMNEGYLRTVTDLDWKIRGVGDFDGDGRADILWRNASTGENYVYFMNGPISIPSEGYLRTVPDQNWRVVGIGDFDGDGRTDIAWRNSSSGENYVYLMQGTNIVGEGYLRTVADLAWQIVALGDYDGDGRSDLLWRNSSTGENYLYPMDGTAVKATEGYLRQVPTNWAVEGR